MPYLNVKLSTPESPETTEQIASMLATLTVDVLKKKRELTSVAFEYISAQRWYIGGASLATQDTATFYLDVKITEGTNTKDEKANYVRRVFAAVESVLGILHPASYIVIHEVRADAWGYAGTTQECRYVDGKRL